MRMSQSVGERLVESLTAFADDLEANPDTPIEELPSVGRVTVVRVDAGHREAGDPISND